MKQMTLGQRIYGLLGILCLLIILMASFSVIRLYKLNLLTKEILDDPLPGIVHIGAVNAGMAETQIRMYRLILSGNTQNDIRILKSEMEKIWVCPTFYTIH